MQLLAHAKINLLLSVRPGVDATGYHAVTSVMCALELADAVRVEPLPEGAEPGVHLTCRPDPLAAQGRPASDNIAHRAARALAAGLGRPLALKVAIDKAIPSQAGLGGGSADAGAVLRALAALWGLDARDVRLRGVAASLGADVPFFLDETPCLFTGRGDVPVERFAPFALPVALVKPPVGVSTAQAYRVLDGLAPTEPDPAPLLAALRARDAAALPALCANNMEGAARACAPELDAVFAFLAGQPGCSAPALLCGSGSCVAQFARTDADAAEIAAAAAERGWWSCATRTLG